MVSHFGSHICGGPECAAKRSQSCSRRLTCGHWCGGVRGEEPPACPPCLTCPHRPAGGTAGCTADIGKNAAGSTEQDGSSGGECCYCLSPLSSAPVISLACGARHLVHLGCARQVLQVRRDAILLSACWLQPPSMHVSMPEGREPGGAVEPVAPVGHGRHCHTSCLSKRCALCDA